MLPPQPRPLYLLPQLLRTVEPPQLLHTVEPPQLPLVLQVELLRVLPVEVQEPQPQQAILVQLVLQLVMELKQPLRPVCPLSPHL